MPDPPSGWSSTQRKVVLACYLGWTLDAFDFFLLVFVLKDIAAEFHTEIGDVTIAILLTLAMRPLGAFLFGRAADRYGRRPTLMVNVVLYSLLEFASGFAPSLTVLIVLRALYGIAMGGEWGVGASLAMETIPSRSRGFVSGLLQAGYPSGYALIFTASCRGERMPQPTFPVPMIPSAQAEVAGRPGSASLAVTRCAA